MSMLNPSSCLHTWSEDLFYGLASRTSQSGHEETTYDSTREKHNAQHNAEDREFCLHVRCLKWQGTKICSPIDRWNKKNIRSQQILRFGCYFWNEPIRGIVHWVASKVAALQNRHQNISNGLQLHGKCKETLKMIFYARDSCNSCRFLA